MAYEHRTRYRCFNCGKEADSTVEASSSCEHSSCGFKTGRWEGFVETFEVSENKPLKIFDVIVPLVLICGAIVATKAGAPEVIGVFGAMLGLFFVGVCAWGFILSFFIEETRDWRPWLAIGWIGGGAVLWLLVNWAAA